MQMGDAGFELFLSCLVVCDVAIIDNIEIDGITRDN